VFESVFAGEVLSLYCQAESTGDYRLELDVDDSRLAELPWELLRDPERETFLAIGRTTALSRIANEAKSRSRLHPRSTKLRVQIQYEKASSTLGSFLAAIEAPPIAVSNTPASIRTWVRQHL
jgi:hypothetical protein